MACVFQGVPKSRLVALSAVLTARRSTPPKDPPTGLYNEHQPGSAPLDAEDFVRYLFSLVKDLGGLLYCAVRVLRVVISDGYELSEETYRMAQDLLRQIADNFPELVRSPELPEFKSIQAWLQERETHRSASHDYTDPDD